MPAKSKSQQRLFGAVHACQKYGKCASPEISKIANSISEKDAEDFARTKHKNLPERKKKLKSFQEFREKELIENLTTGDQQAGIDTAKYFRVMGKWLNEIEEKLQLKGQQTGEQANQWHQQAVQILQSVLRMVESGKQTWQMNQQIRNSQNAQQKAVPPGQQKVTHLDDIG